LPEIEQECKLSDFPALENAVQKREGCLPTALFVFFLIWLSLISLIGLLSQWLIENLLFEGSLGLPDIRLFVHAAYVVLSGVPAVVFRGMGGLFRAYYRGVFYSLIAATLMMPASLVSLTDFQTAGLIIIGALAITVWILRKTLSNYGGENFASNFRKSLFAAIALLGGLMALPYVLWGALGSPLDVISGIILGGLFGWLMSLLLEQYIHSYRALHPAGMPPSLFLKILYLISMIMILCAGLPVVGFQFSLTLPMMVSSIGAAVISSVLETNPPKARRLIVALWAGICAALPLLFIDGDELMLVISSMPGDLLGYAVRMALLHGLIALGGGVTLFLCLRKPESFLASRLMITLAILVWGLAVSLYLTVGQPGFYGEKLFVVLKDQVVFNPRQLPQDPVERRKMVFQELVEKAENSQLRIRSILNRFNVQYRSYYLVNALEVNGGPIIRLWLQGQPEVDRVLLSPRLRPLSQQPPLIRGSYAKFEGGNDWNLNMIRAPQVWEEYGVRGQGIIIGLSDSGADWNHPELREQYRGVNGSHDYNWLDVWFGNVSPRDTNGHGTHTLGSILGKNVGVAPAAKWIGCVNLARNLGNPAVYLDCWQFLFAPYPQNGDAFRDGKPELGAHIFNNSWGCPEVEGCDALVFLPAVRALKAAGVFVVVSAGNSGYAGCGSVDAPPAIYEEVLTVGAVNRNGDLAGFSSVGPVQVDGSMRIKAEILAPGEEIFSSYPDQTYEFASGTSMAGPHVAGVVALMWSANPVLIGKVDVTRNILFEAAQPYNGILPECVAEVSRPAQGIGYGIVDAYSAVSRALEVP